MRRFVRLLAILSAILLFVLHAFVRPQLAHAALAPAPASQALPPPPPPPLIATRSPPSAERMTAAAVRTKPAPVVAPNPALAPVSTRCASIRHDRLLLYAAHSGFGNQELALRRALLIAYVLNRTLVLPPLLRQSDVAFGPPEVRCRNASALAQLQARAEYIYAAKLRTSEAAQTLLAATASTASPVAYESMLDVFDFRGILQLGLRLVDYAQLPRATRATLGTAPYAPLRCAKGERYTASGLRKAARALADAPILRLGSPYFLKAVLDGLRTADRCFDALSRAVLRLPLSQPIEGAAAAALRRLDGPFASVHLRLADAAVTAASGPVRSDTRGDAAAAAAAEATLHREVRWLKTRLSRRLQPAGCCGLYVATNLQGGVRAPALASLCAPAEPRAYNCSDLATVGATLTPEFRALLDAGRLSAGTATLLLEQALSAAAGRGFFSTSKFCGPPGFRKSTFSEGIALRWQLRHAGEGATPLCAHAMEHALLQGRAAHGDHVY